MSREYLEDLGMEALIGKHVTSVLINTSKDMVVLETTSGKYYLTWEGGCCSQCFLANASGIDALKDAEIKKIEHAAWEDISTGEYTVLESMGTKIKTTKGYVSLETRLSHNGYYSGYILVSDVGPLDQYHSLRQPEESELNPLEDF